MILDNPRHEKFAQMVAAGSEQGPAYEACGFVARGKSAWESASRLVKDKGMAARIAELRAEADKKSRMSKDELLKYLVDVIRTPAGDVTDDHQLCQSYKHTESERSLKIPDKLRAAELLARICGWNEPDKVQHDVTDTLSAILNRVRNGTAKR